MKKESAGKPGVVSLTDVLDLLQTLEVKLQSPEGNENAIGLCHSACSHSWNCDSLQPN